MHCQMSQNEAFQALTLTHFVVLNGREFYESCEIWYCTLGVVQSVFYQLFFNQTGDLFLHYQKTILDFKLKVGCTINYYLNRWMQFGCWNSQHHAQTLHPTENFILMNFLQMPCVIYNMGSKKSASNLRKKMKSFFSFTQEKFRFRVNQTITHNLLCIKMLPHLEIQNQAGKA